MTHKPVYVRFMQKVDTSGECWVWRSATNPVTGYGMFSYRGQNVGAHRRSWEMHHGQQIPEGLWVLHRCDNPPCVRPDHLFLGTALMNVEDSILKGRRPRKAPRVYQYRQVTPEEHDAIRQRRSEGATYRELAREFRRGIVTIYHVLRRERERRARAA